MPAVDAKNMVVVGGIIGAVGLGIMIAAASSASEIRKAKSCANYPEGAYNMTTGVSVVSGLVFVAGVAAAGIGIWQMAKKGSKTSPAFYRFNF